MPTILDDIVVFDIETEPMGKEFFDAQSRGEDTFNYVPNPRVCVCYDSITKEHSVFLPDQFKDLYKTLKNRNILSFNGINFDIKVILKYLSKKPKDALAKKKNHYDLLKMIVAETDKRYSLDDLVRANFGERKHTDGRKMEGMDIDKLTEACQSDVDHTYRLMESFLAGNLVYKHFRKPREDNVTDVYDEAYTRVPLSMALKLMEHNKKRDTLVEAIINSGRYSETDKLAALDDFLMERTGKTFDIICGNDGIGLCFEHRWISISELLMSLGVTLPVITMLDDGDMTEGQYADSLMYGE